MSQPLTVNPLANNLETVTSYELIARDYADSTVTPEGVGSAGLRRLVATLDHPADSTVLELGSGPGWDADFVESLGPAVRRTDVTQAFVDFQVERGKQADHLDAITGEYGGPYDAVVALCVLIHIDRELTSGVLAKVAGALRPGGSFLVSLREGVGDLWERGSSGNRYHVVLWDEASFGAELAAVGLHSRWSARSLEGDGNPWLTVLATKNEEAGR